VINPESTLLINNHLFPFNQYSYFNSYISFLEILHLHLDYILKICLNPNPFPPPVNVTSFGNRASAGANKLR
jgi:hypothetical protein